MPDGFNILLIDGDHALGQALARQLRDRGHRVAIHARAGSTGDGAPLVDLVGTDVASLLAPWDAQHGPFDRVVFGLAGASESFDALVDANGAVSGLTQKLGELQAVAQLLCRRDDSQMWMLVPEDSMRYCLPVLSQPVRSRALIAAAKSLAKEIFGFGVRLNVVQLQSMAEDLSAEAWRAARADLKAYALKFSPQPRAQVAALLLALIEQPALPVSGLVIPVGVGYVEANV